MGKRQSSSIRYSTTYPELILSCPIPDCNRDFTISNTRTPVKGVDLPRYLNHYKSNSCTQRRSTLSSSDITGALDGLPESHRVAIFDSSILSPVAPCCSVDIGDDGCGVYDDFFQYNWITTSTLKLYMIMTMILQLVFFLYSQANIGIGV